MKKSLWQLMRPAVFSILLAVFVDFLCNMSVIGLMAAAAYLVTSAALRTPLYELSLAITGVRACGIFRAVFRYAGRYISHNAAFGIWQELRKHIYKNVVKALPFSENTLHSGEIFAVIIESLDDLRDAVLRLILPPLGGLLMSAALFLFMLPYSKTTAIVFAGAFFIIVIFLPFIFYPRVKETSSSLETELYEFIDGAEDIAAFNYGERRVGMAYSKIDEMVHTEDKLFSFTVFAETIARIAAAAAIAAILAVFIDILPQITAVNAAVLLLAGIAAFEILVPLAGLGEQLQKAVIAYGKLKILLKPHLTDLPEPSAAALKKENLLTVHDMSFAYEKDMFLYDKLNFCLKKGDKTALIGGSGSGKSTIVNLLLRLLAYNSGSVFWQDTAYNYIDEQKLRENIKAALQEQYIFDMTIRENFKIIYPDITDEEIYAALKSAGLIDFVMHVPQKLDTCTGRGGRYLSGGQCRRLSIAMALARKAPLLIIDEPTAGLDVLTADEIINTIINIGIDHTVLVITHDMASIEKFDKILVLDKKRIVQAGTPAELMETKGYFSDMIKYRNAI